MPKPKPIATLLLFLLCPGALHAAPEAPKLKVCMLSGSDEYGSDASLAAFQDFLERRCHAQCTLLKARGVDTLPGLEALDDCDVALVFTRRLKIDGEALERVRAYCRAGRPLVGVRTASHGFQNWLEFDPTVLGGHYSGHYRKGPTVEVKARPEAASHPILEGVGTIRSVGSLYKASPLADDAEPLLMGTTPEATEPVAWTRRHAGGRVFYTSLGSQGDFENAAFRRLLTNALFWAADRTPTIDPPAPPTDRPRPEGSIRLRLRSRVQAFKGSDAWDEVTLTREIPVAEAAIILCDMWDSHWCRGASERCDALARKMDPVVRAARAKGVQIIHAPSETMDFYADTPQRLRMLRAPAAPLPRPLDLTDPPLPIDDSDGGCDTGETPWYRAWTRQSPHIAIGPDDGISADGQEVYNLLHQRGIKYLLVAGVHTNMCVLKRPFTIRAMTRLGIKCILIRDLTDALYDPNDRPYVSHDEGTGLVVEHIEKYWAPSILSNDLLAGMAPAEKSAFSASPTSGYDRLYLVDRSCGSPGPGLPTASAPVGGERRPSP